MKNYIKIELHAHLITSAIFTLFPPLHQQNTTPGPVTIHMGINFIGLFENVADPHANILHLGRGVFAPPDFYLRKAIRRARVQCWLSFCVHDMTVHDESLIFMTGNQVSSSNIKRGSANLNPCQFKFIYCHFCSRKFR